MGTAELHDEHLALDAGGDRRQRPGRTQLAVTFRRPDGAEDTFSYAHLYRLRLEADNTALTIEFSEHTVTLSGRNLRRLARQVANHAEDLVEANPDDRDFTLPGDGRSVVHRIDIASRSV